MKKLIIIVLLGMMAFKGYKSHNDKNPPDDVIINDFKCLKIDGINGNPGWSDIVRGDGWHNGLKWHIGREGPNQMKYSIPYQARIAEFRFNKTAKIKAIKGPAKEELFYYTVHVYRKIERQYNRGSIDEDIASEILPRKEVLDQTLFYYKYINGTWRYTSENMAKQ